MRNYELQRSQVRQSEHTNYSGSASVSILPRLPQGFMTKPHFAWLKKCDFSPKTGMKWMQDRAIPASRRPEIGFVKEFTRTAYLIMNVDLSHVAQGPEATWAVGCVEAPVCQDWCCSLRNLTKYSHIPHLVSDWGAQMLINFRTLLSRNISEEKRFSPQEAAVQIFIFYLAPNFRGKPPAFCSFSLITESLYFLHNKQPINKILTWMSHKKYLEGD